MQSILQRQIPLPRFGPALLISLCMLSLSIASPILAHRYVDPSAHSIATYGYVAIFGAGIAASVTFFLPVPMLMLTFVGGAILNPFLLALAASAGITLGMAPMYFVGGSGEHVLQRAIAQRGDWFKRLVDRVIVGYRGHVTVVSYLLATLPNPVFDYASLIAGFARVSISRFLFASFLGRLTQTTVVALAGYYSAGQVQNIW